MKTNRNGIRIIGPHTRRPNHRRLYAGDPRIRIEPTRDDNMTWLYPEPDITHGLMEAIYELRTTLPSVIPPGQSVNTRRGVPGVPTFKGVRFLGKLSFPERIKLRLRNIGHAVTRTGVYAH